MLRHNFENHDNAAECVGKVNAPKMSQWLVRSLVQRHKSLKMRKKWPLHHRAIMHEFLLNNFKEEDTGNIWFPQDGATFHRSHPR